MTRYPNIPAVWMGDFNTTLCPALDRLQTTQSLGSGTEKTTFSKMVSAFHLVDTWRHKFPQARAYSCFSSTHNSMSHIDFILLSCTLTPRVLDTAFCPRLLSDHSPYWTTLSIPVAKPMRP